MLQIDAVGVKKLENIKTLQREAYRLWMVGLTFSIVSGLYKVYGQQQRAQHTNSKEGEGAVEVKKLERERKATMRQLVSDLCDICAPIYTLGYSNRLDDGIVGLAGTMSSILGVMSQWKNTA